jgi:hypothetical protein
MSVQWVTSSMDLARGLAIPHSGGQEKKHVAKCYTGAQTWQAFVNMVINIWVQLKGKCLLTSQRRLLHGVS